MDRYFLAAAVVIGALSFVVPASADNLATADKVAQCRTDLDSCRYSIALVALGVKCAPTDEDPSDAEVEGVLSWLEAHPQIHPDDWAAASEAALQALYPCSN